MWDFFETVRHRHSVRKFQNNRPIEQEKLHAILEMACAAPSAGDLQAYCLWVVHNQKKREQLQKASLNQSFISESPVCLAFCSDPERSAEKYGERGRRLYSVQDATIAASYAQLAIVAAGMASTWVGNFNEDEVSSILDLKAQIRPVALLSIGYPAELPPPSPRRRLDEIIHYIS
ncbi:MAG: nitroreductase [Gammaproteobacteria bacterium]|nr:nitroreductase [Gammaproteobacteria bacterium]